MATVDLELVADFSKASKSLSKFTKEANSSLDDMKSAFGALKAIAATALAAFSIKKITDAAAENEQAIKSLNTALALTGDYSEQSSKHLQEFALNLQKNSSVSDETALSLVGLTKSMGATNEQTEKIIQTAADLSAITGDSLEASVESLSKTLGGTAGRLSQTQHELKGLTEQELKNGVAIDILSQKYKGAAKEMTNTFAGSVRQTENAFGDLMEELGALITQNPIVIEAVKLVGQAFNEFGEYIKKNRKAIIDFSIDAIGNAVKIFAFLIDEVGSTVAIFKNFDAVIDLVYMSLGELGLAAIDVADVLIKAFKSVINLAITPTLVGINALAEGLKFIGVISEEQLARFQQGLSDLAMDSDTSGLESLRKDVEGFTNAAREGFLETSENLLQTKDNFTSTAEKVNSFADSLLAMKDITDDSNKSLKKLNETNKALKNDIAFKDRTFLGGRFTGQNIIDAGYATAGAITKGGAGLNSLVSAGAGAAANAFLPGSGEAVSAITGMLAQGPEATKAMVQGFIDQIPVLIDALADAMPVLVQTLAENTDEIIIALVKGMPKVALALAIEVPIALAKSLPGVFAGLAQELFSNLQKGMKEFFGNFVQGLMNGIKEAFAGIGGFFKGLGTQIWNGLKEGLGGIGKLLTGIFDKINPANLFEKIFKVDMGGKGTVEKTLGIDIPFMSFARGGIVPGRPRVPGDSLLNDNILSLVSPGEAIIPRSKMKNPLIQELVDGILGGDLPMFGWGGWVGDRVREAGGGISDTAKNAVNTISDVGGQLSDEFKKVMNTFLGPLWAIVRDMVLNKMVFAMLEKNKFQAGGEVPRGYPNDTFPSMLSSGENVIDRSTNERLRDFLDGANRPTRIVLQVGERELSEVLLNLNRQGYRTA